MAELPQRADRDRRHQPRYAGDRLMANVNGLLVEVADISLTSISLKTEIKSSSGPLLLTLYPRDGSKLTLNEGLRVKADLIRCENGVTALKFQTTTLALSRLVIKLTANRLGIDPYFVK